MPKCNHTTAARLRARAARALGALAAYAVSLQTALAAAPTSGAALPAGSVLQVVAGLAAVLGLVGAAAWLAKRYSGVRATGPGMIRIVGGAAVGQRERIVLVEVGATWLLVGVAPGQVRTLHTMPRAETATPTGAPAPAAPAFSTWLQRMTDKRNRE